MRQVELIEPTVICTLGNFSTKLLRGDPTGITRLHGQPEVIALGSRAVRLYPIYHPAAALYTPRMLETLREDFARLPELLALGAPEQPAADGPVPEAASRGRRGAGRRARRGSPHPSRTPQRTSSACSRACPADVQPVSSCRRKLPAKEGIFGGCRRNVGQVLKSAAGAADEDLSPSLQE